MFFSFLSQRGHIEYQVYNVEFFREQTLDLQFEIYYQFMARVHVETVFTRITASSCLFVAYPSNLSPVLYLQGFLSFLGTKRTGGFRLLPIPPKQTLPQNECRDHSKISFS